MFVIVSSPSSNEFDFHIEAPDEIIAKRDVVGSTTTDDWDVVEMDMLENDPVYLASDAHNITNTKILDWDAAYSRGDHRTMGYLT
ncbi:MAG: hypothetical protein WCH65_06545 [bacterium]